MDRKRSIEVVVGDAGGSRSSMAGGGFRIAPCNMVVVCVEGRLLGSGARRPRPPSDSHPQPYVSKERGYERPECNKEGAIRPVAVLLLSAAESHTTPKA